MNSEHKSMFKTTEIWLSNPCDLYEYCSLSLRHLSLNSGSTFSWNDHKGSFNLLFSCLLYIWENCIWKRLTFTSKYCTKFLVFLYIIHLPISITGHLKWVFWTIKMLSHPGTLHTTMWAFYIMSIYMQYVCVCVVEVSLQTLNINQAICKYISDLSLQKTMFPADLEVKRFILLKNIHFPMENVLYNPS